MACVKTTLSGEKLPGLAQGKPCKILVFSMTHCGSKLAACFDDAIFGRGKCMEEQARVIRDDTKGSPYVFQSGDIAIVSGLYRRDHSKCNTSPAIDITKGERFPDCPHCGEAANFLLERKLNTLKRAQVVPINR